jgi:hypothetical protein
LFYLFPAYGGETLPKYKSKEEECLLLVNYFGSLYIDNEIKLYFRFFDGRLRQVRKGLSSLGRLFEFFEKFLRFFTLARLWRADSF